MNIIKQSIGLGVALLLLSSHVNAAERPQTMEEMWKIIEAQQEQLDAMKKMLEETKAAPPPVAQERDQTHPQTDTEIAESQQKTDEEVAELKHKTNVLTEAVESMRTALVLPDKKELKSTYGLGPAASKVYQVDQGLSIGGYGEMNYQAIVADKGSKNDNADLERLVLYLGYKFTDSIIFNSEIEFEHSTTAKNGSVSAEMMTLDFLLDPMVNVRTGLMLVPMGFINLIHEPPFYFGNNRPEVERVIIPTTWRSLGAGLFGQIVPDLNYTMYAVDSLDAEGFTSAGIRGGRQQGSKALAEDWAFIGRLDYTPSALPGLTFGASSFLGNTGQDQIDANVFTQLYEAHMEWKYYGFETRVLGSWGHIGDAATLSALKKETIGSSNYGVYAEVAYNILPLIFTNTSQYLAPFFRYEKFDTIATAPTGYKDDLKYDQDIFQVGFNYKPIPEVVIKLDYRNRNAKAGTVPDEVNVGFGFIF
ncbi:hypothetical protein AU255_15585 [Methyloprofundus sedimenti]|uniref:Porin n=1 Tax=Methyloprofundus sedimenti TaxID=1420851 RepID=A0A1V8M256_9GAMM|nr:hypothetical protein [Methyloprofundus sedimenti]OQK15641.1 hypothetical protein AU255_15585 [Methyloprofundus sedimenti]